MSNDLYRELTHREMQQVIKLHLEKFGLDVKDEFTLPNARIADIWYECSFGTVIIECKTLLSPYVVESVWMKYRTQSNYLAIAAPPAEIRMITNAPPIWGWPMLPADIGYISVEHAGPAEVKGALWHLGPPTDAGGEARGDGGLVRAERVCEKAKTPGG
jgi:hypothetical protein